MALLLDTMLLLPGAAWLAGWSRPRCMSAWLAAGLAMLFAEIVVITEAVGRVRFTPGAISAGCAAAGLAGVLAWWRRPMIPRRLVQPEAWARRAGLAGSDWPMRAMAGTWAAMMLFSVVAVATLPPSVPDALRYHLPMAVRWVQEGRVGVFDFLDYRANYFPHNVEILNAWCLLGWGSDRLMCLPQVAISGLGWPLACYLALRGCCSMRRRPAALGALLASMTAPVVLQMRNEMVDAGFTALFVLALAAALARGRLFGRSWLVVGTAAGLALGSKSSGVLAAGVVGMAWITGLLIEARPGGVMPWKRAMTEFAAASPIVLAAGSWVYAANLAAHGNPFFPIALKVGPLSFSGAGPGHPIHANPWTTDFGESPVGRIGGGLARWPKLLLSVPPFHRFRSAGSGGFGYLTTGCVVAAVVLAGAAAGTAEGRRRLRRGLARGLTVALVAALLAWNVLFLAFVSLITAPYSLVDARYQVHLALLGALGAVIGLEAVARRTRAAATWALAAAFVATAYVAVTDCPQRGWSLLRAVTLGGRDRLYAYTGRPIYVADDPRALLESLGDEPMMVMARGRIYPFYYPSFNRMIYPVTHLGADQRQVNRPDIPAGVLQASLDLLAESKGLLTPQNTGSAGDWREASGRFASQPRAREAAAAYWTAMARRYGVRWLYSDAGPLEALEGSAAWALVVSQQGPNPSQAMALYRFAGDPVAP